MGRERVPLDSILALQLTIAWAGEAMAEPPRMSWWETDLFDEAGGGDLFARLFARTRRWASLEAIRKAAISADTRARLSMAEPDEVRTLFFWGFDIDEALRDRLSFHKHSGADPVKALPIPVDLDAEFRREDLEEALRLPGREVRFKVVPGGRELSDSLPEPPKLKAKYLSSAFLPLADHYPAPFFRI